MEGVRGAGIEGDIAIDDVTIEEGECKDPPPHSEYTCGVKNPLLDKMLPTEILM